MVKRNISQILEEFSLEEQAVPLTKGFVVFAVQLHSTTPIPIGKNSESGKYRCLRLGQLASGATTIPQKYIARDNCAPLHRHSAYANLFFRVYMRTTDEPQ